MNFLIVEDEFLIQKSIVKLLQRKGHTVLATPSGTHALELLKNHFFDRVICDLMLKDITGFEVIEEAKTFLSPEDIKKKFILITAYSSEQIFNLANQNNLTIIKKPFDDFEKTIEFFEK